MGNGEVVQSFSMEPRTLEEAMQFAKLIAESDLVPRDFKGKPGNVLIALQMARELGVPGLQGIQNIAVINGRPSIWGDLALALVKGKKASDGQPLCEDFREDFDESTMTATCQAKRRGQPTAITHHFSKTDAEKAGLWKKEGTWQNYPKRMLQMRARAFVLRDGFADVLKGVSIAEEQQDVMDVTPASTALPAPPSPPRRASAPPSEVVQPPPPPAPVSTPANGSDWTHMKAAADTTCRYGKEPIKKGDQVVFNPKQGVRCLACDPTAGPKEVT